MTIEWNDITGTPGWYGETWAIASGAMCVVVTQHPHFPGDWLMRCDEIGCHGSALKSRDITSAKREALERVRVRGEAILARVAKMQEVTP